MVSVVKLAVIVIIFLALLSLSNANPNEQSEIEKADKKSRDTLAGLYTVIRNVALPPTSNKANGNEPLEQRLLLLIPGKVLSYNDYFPGNEYETYLENPDHGYTKKKVSVPPRVMENMFSLADVIAGSYPLRGAETGESMAVIYESILNKLEVRGFHQKSALEKERYVTAIAYLSEEIPDPLNVIMSVTRFQLYRRSQELYNQRRLQMEDKIDTERNDRNGTDFELWFQRNYPSLKSQVEGAYTEWLIFGQKEIVELYKSYLDVESPGVDLEKARMSLRASGVSSLDRTRTIYPVSFIPGNWYRYLTNVTRVDEAEQKLQEEEMQSRDEILVKIGELEAQKHVMLSLKAAKPSKKLIDKFRELDQSLATSNSNLSDFANDTEQLRQQCLISRIQAKVDNTNGDTSECQKYAEATGNAEHSVGSNTELFACVKDLDFQVNSFDKKQKALNETVTLINNQIDVLQERLALKSVKMTHLAREALHVADTQDQLDSNWLSFSFSSSHKEVETSQSSRQSSFSVSVDVSTRMWGVSSSYSSSKSESRFSNRMNSADTLVEGQLLRVSIQRPWFRPSLFKSHQYEIRNNQKAKVSPGPNYKELDFSSKIASNEYMLPQYVTGLLLSRNVVIEYKGIDAATAGHAVYRASKFSVSAKANFGLWKARVSGGYQNSRSSRSYSMESTSDGLRISIPGAQIIGYYTKVVPKFPSMP